jgi:hypothetical protein
VEVGTRVGYLRAAEPAARAPFDADDPIVTQDITEGDIVTGCSCVSWFCRRQKDTSGNSFYRLTAGAWATVDVDQ